MSAAPVGNAALMRAREVKAVSSSSSSSSSPATTTTAATVARATACKPCMVAGAVVLVGLLFWWVRR